MTKPTWLTKATANKPWAYYMDIRHGARVLRVWTYNFDLNLDSITAAKARSAIAWIDSICPQDGGAAVKPVDTLSCLRCEHTWSPKESRPPKVCPKCKSPYWSRPRERKDFLDGTHPLSKERHGTP